MVFFWWNYLKNLINIINSLYCIVPSNIKWDPQNINIILVLDSMPLTTSDFQIKKSGFSRGGGMKVLLLAVWVQVYWIWLKGVFQQCCKMSLAFSSISIFFNVYSSKYVGVLLKFNSKDLKALLSLGKMRCYQFLRQDISSA